ncbi:ATP-binding cassette domain-containing protein [Embleya sp. AB8]|uniref:ATP-binding cassette domain-containing protein n=1 Tax=Embleya sp. AB8 TaxID=3156304 RepID=UPI003C73FCE9
MTASGPPAVSAEGLRKTYGAVEAVAGVDLRVEAGESFGFLGPNGAGKSTTIALLTTLARPTGGRAFVAGVDVVRDPARARRHLGVVFQETTLDHDLTAWENLRFHAELHGVPRRETRARIADMLELVGLAAEQQQRTIRTFSGGMKRRLEIARGLLHTPDVLFLDEPTLGLDPYARNQLWEHLHRVRQERRTTVFLTTHYLDEADQCDRIAIIDHGRIVAQDTPTALKTAIGHDTVTLRTTDDEAARRALAERFGRPATVGPAGLRVHVPDGPAILPRLCTELGVTVLAATTARPSLDDVFLHHTGRDLHATEPAQPPALPRPTTRT